MTETDFNFNDALKSLQAGKPLSGKDGILTPLIKQLTEAALAAELEAHIENEEASNRQNNRKNGSSTKTIKSTSGSFELATPRDRTGTFEPQLIKKHQTHLTDEIERKILSLYALGGSYRDISGHVQELYGIDVSSATINAVTDKVIPRLKEWQQRPLESHYPFVWLDAIHYKVRESGAYRGKAVYTVLGLKLDGTKEILGLYLSENEGANFWLSVLTDLHNRGVKDILIASVDGLSGFPDAINSIFLDTEVQLCIIHQIRNSMKYVASKNRSAFMADLKPVYRAVSKEAAEVALDELEEKWGKQYPIVIKSWRNKWHNLSIYFKYPEPIRKVIYTTDTIDKRNRAFCGNLGCTGDHVAKNSILR
tara:strand:- start:1840 stop:2934 length:1095 start_codon:yes stop_codon:yes gene_type:complete